VGNVPEGAPLGGPPDPGNELLTPCCFRHFSNFFSAFLVDVLAAALEDAEAAVPPTMSEPPESARTSTTASAEQKPTRARRDWCELSVVKT
jgi:hypothetical protein